MIPRSSWEEGCTANTVTSLLDGHAQLSPPLPVLDPESYRTKMGEGGNDHVNPL